MFQYDWASSTVWSAERPVSSDGASRLSRDDVEEVMLLHWQEHCLECASPECYRSCSLFVSRADQKCTRLFYGIVPNRNFAALLDCGADLLIQTAVSKNNHADVIPLLQRFGLEDYFLYPAINWGAKSENLRQIADHLNINIDTFALIDDSPFERRQVTAALPMVRVYPETDLEQLLSRPEFDVAVTAMNKQRRLSYVTEQKRERAKAMFAEDYADFLRSCELRLRLFAPREKADVDRCLELIQRSNQLKLSTRTFDAAGFERLLKSDDDLSIAMYCEDKFGSCGIVGFATVREAGATPVITDFAMSCRVANKRLERTFFRLARAEGAGEGGATSCSPSSS